MIEYRRLGQRQAESIIIQLQNVKVASPSDPQNGAFVQLQLNRQTIV